MPRIQDISHAEQVAASQIDDLDDAISRLQKVAGIEDGGVASLVFSGVDDAGRDSYAIWKTASTFRRRRMIMLWLSAEAAAA